MNTILLDDELPAIKILSQFSAKVPFLNIKVATTNSFEVLELLSTEKVDLLMTDIEMPDLSGVELIRSLEQRPMVIFTTAYEDYALQGYELDIVDYLVKPIRFERFLKAINKAHKLYKFNQQFTQKENSNHLTVKVEYQSVNIQFKDIIYIESLKDYVRIHTVSKRIVTRLNLKGILSKLPHDAFIRIHRSYIASKNFIDSFTKSQITIAGQKLPIGESFQASVTQFLK